MRKALDTRCRENRNTFYAQQLFSVGRAVYEIMRKDMVEPYRPQIAI